jgi:hypothetical protein
MNDHATKADLATVETRLVERLETVETRLLTEFHKYAQASERRMLASEVVTHAK